MRWLFMICTISIVACGYSYDTIKDEFDGYEIKRMNKNYAYGGTWTHNGVLMNLQVFTKGTQEKLGIYLVYIGSEWLFIKEGYSLKIKVGDEIIQLSTHSEPNRETKIMPTGSEDKLHTIETVLYNIEAKQLEKILNYPKPIKFNLEGQKSEIREEILSSCVTNMKDFYQDVIKK